MAQNNYIRPLTRNYHDFTQRKVEQTDYETPYKFKNREPEAYIKKPKKTIVERPLIQPVIEPPQPKSCCQKYCGCFQSMNKKDNKIGQCCFGFRCFQPQICGNCVSKICRDCLEKMCLKFRLCNVCLHVLCKICRDNVFDVSCRNCCSSEPKLRNYPIRMKNKGNLHFVDCKCVDCVQMVPPNDTNLIVEQAIKMNQMNPNMLQNNGQMGMQVPQNNPKINQIFESSVNQMNPNMPPNNGQMRMQMNELPVRNQQNQMYQNVESKVTYQHY